MIPQVNNPVVQYQCDGVNKTYIWPYDFNNIKDINLILVDEDGRQTEQTGNILYDAQNKTLTYPSIGEPLPATYKVVLVRRTPISQTTELANKWPYNHIEDMTDKIILILQELKEQLDRTLQINVGADEDPNQVTRDIVDNSIEAAKKAIAAASAAEEKANEVQDNATKLTAINDNINALSQTVDDKLSTANTALIQSADTFEKTQKLADNTKAYAAKAETDKKNINDLVAKADAIKTDISNKQIASVGNAKKAEDAAKRAEVAAAKAEEISIPGGRGIVTKSEADAKYIGKESLNGIVSVKDFGAVGDGVTDDTAAFKRANDNLANKILLVPNGQYKLTEHLTFNTVGSVMDMGVYTNIKPYYPTETPMLKGASNIAFVKNITYDAELNQCQGFTYNSKKNVFVLACINGEGTNQIFYDLNSDTFEKVGTYKFTDSERLGHCNTMTYNRYTNKIYLTNGLKNGNNLTVINADTMAIENTITLQEKVFNIDYDPITRTYVSIVPIAGNQRVRTINLYNDEFKKLKTYQVDYIYPDMNNNGAFMLNGAIMSATLGSLVECTPFGTVKQIIEINRETEIEDIAYYNGKFYFAVLTQKPNKRHQVDIYVGDPSREYENSINTQKLASLDYLKLTGGNVTGAIKMANNTLIEGFKTDGHGVGIAKVSTNDGIEYGDASVNVFMKGKEFKHYDGTDSFTVLTTKHYGTAIYNKKQIDDAFVKKGDVGSVSNSTNKQMTITHPLFGDGATESGDCTFIGVDGKWFIIDSYAKTDANLNSILKCMTDNNIEKFEFGFVSHYHNDHIGNFAELIKRGKITKMYMPNPDKTEVIGRYGMTAQVLNTVANGIKAECTAKNVPIETIVPQTINFNGASITFYNCSDEDYNYYRSINNDDYNNVSACLEINYLNRTAIFEGDCNYNAMERNAMRNPVNVDYLKSNHHGISNVPLSYRKLNPRDLVMTTTQDIARSNLYIQNFQNTFQQLGSNIYLLGNQVEPPMITYKGDGSITYNRKLLRDGTAGHATSLEIFVDRNYTGQLKTGDMHSPFTYLADAVRFINQIKHASVKVNIKAGDYTRAEDKGSVHQPRKELTIQNVNNRVIFQRQGGGVVNLPPIVINCCRYIHFKDVEFIGVSAGDNRKIHVYESSVVLENVKADSQKDPSNNTSNIVIVGVQGNSLVKLVNVNFSAGWGAINTNGGTVILAGNENHVATSHAYVVGVGDIYVHTPFVEKNNVNKSGDSSAVELGNVYFKPIRLTTDMPTGLAKGTVVPVKNTDKPQEQSFIQANNKVWIDMVYSIVNPTTTTVPDYTGQIGINGEEVFIGANGKWVKISN